MELTSHQGGSGTVIAAVEWIEASPGHGALTAGEGETTSVHSHCEGSLHATRLTMNSPLSAGNTAGAIRLGAPEAEVFIPSEAEAMSRPEFSRLRGGILHPPNRNKKTPPDMGGVLQMNQADFAD